MGHALMEVRHTGMRVATALSHILSPESPLVFDDLPPDEEEAKDNDNVIVSCIKTTGGIDGGKLNLTDKSLNHVNELEQVTIDENLDALVQSDSDDESGDSVVSLDAYEDLSDNDDDDKGNQMIIDQVLQNRASLVYMWQVKEGLVMEDNRDVTEVALASLPRVIARQPHDLHHMAGKITTVLLRLDDSFQTHVLDDLLMAHVLHTLARVLEATGKNSPHVVSMGKRFLELLWSQRSHALPSVRRQVGNRFWIYVFVEVIRFEVMLVLPSFVWQEEVDRLNLGPHLVPFLQYHKDMDPDGGCRTAANLLLTTISQG
ncbi:hypothetical protein DYB25_012637 [Aphanomyces astaci]|uniref:Telomere length regulation protein conserved domain-containing protein n=1 Tax=Aphanomyces astaci TaxID=112090 RepID=A0A397BZE0_APHAT|nr:hypothetical protein DYB25_012637 [Aphanomyces astaci]